jgi:hypothetical protein
MEQAAPNVERIDDFSQPGDPCPVLAPWRPQAAWLNPPRLKMDIMEIGMRQLLRLRLIGGLIAAGALGACYHTHTASGVLYVRSGPPSDRVEVISTSPGDRYVWVGGHWGWRDPDYFWVPGAWAIPASGYTVWTPGHWAHDGHGWFWVDGRWR